MSRELSLEEIIKIRLAYGAGSAKAFKLYTLLSNGGSLDENDSKKLNSVSNGKVQSVINDSKANGIEIVPINSKIYPDCLRNISEPPLVLFIKGKLPDFDNLPTVTVVGPRKVSPLGEKSAYSLCSRLSKAGFTVVSGAALGGDTAALKGALCGKGIPVGVLACGLCCDYLPENRRLRNKIAEKGCLISEHPPFAPTGKFCFPIRNRIMAALSQSTVVIEAGEKSGTLVTARYAADQGKDVFVIPGRINDKSCKGSNALLRDGALPLLDSSDIFNLYLPHFADKIDLKAAFEENKSENKEKIQKKSISGLSKEAEILYNNIIDKKFSADDMLKTGLSGESILSALTELEFTGLIKSLPGGYYEII